MKCEYTIRRRRKGEYNTMKYTKICKCCGKPFETNSSQKIYCNRIHYLPCPVCGKLVAKKDNDFSIPPKCCSTKCRHELRQSKFKQKKCILCGKMFTPKSGIQIACDDIHYDKCEICGRPFVRTIKNLNDNVTTCSNECAKEKTRRRNREKYGVDHPMQNPEVQKHFHDAMEDKYGVRHALQIPGKINQQQSAAYATNMKNNGVPYACMLPQCISAQGNIVSHLNTQFANRLKEQGLAVSLEKRINNMSYDICIEETKTLIELNPSYTHSIVPNHWGTSRDKYYHRDKSLNATKEGYRCIHVFDWDNTDKIIESLSPKVTLYGRNMTIYKLKLPIVNEFLNKYHLQGTCRGQLLCLGLVRDNELYQVMTFGKSRYDKSHTIELLRLCTKSGYRVVGGASKLFKYATEYFGLDDIISYCDLSKFNGDVYNRLGMKKIRTSPPQEVWSKNNQKVTANLLRQRGYDQLFGTNYGKGTSNEELMLTHGWLPVYDCGQAVYLYQHIDA